MMNRLYKIYKGRLVAKDAKELIDDGICPKCCAKLYAPVREEREGGHSELVTYCPCGATYTGRI